jgi:outer membrane receptor protein involved in Fe transport
MEIVSTARLPQAPVPPSRIPAAVQVIESADLSRAGVGFPAAIAAKIPGASLSDEQGNSYQPDLSLRGFQTGPVVGLPQGVSVFLDGVRVNEPTAEEINFDLLPMEDLERVEIIPGPSVVFGRNTLAGAINLVTERGKEGFSASAEAVAGSAAYRKYRLRFSGRVGPVDYYASGTETLEDGWRDATQSRLSRLFSKVGYRAGGSDLTLSYQHASTRIEQAGSLPTSILDQNRSANYTPGDFFSPLLDVVTLNARRRLSDTVSLSANGFGRWLSVEQFNVNFLNDDSRLFSRTATQGATLELERTGPILGRPNLFSAGIEGSHSEVNVNVFNERNARSAPCESAADCALRHLDTSVHDRQDALAAYVQDNLELGRSLFREDDQIFLTVAARWDLVRHRIDDRSPPADGRPSASGDDVFQRINPLVGLSYNFSADHSLYASYAEGFRAPALLELTCAGPAAICPGLQAGAAPDPPLNPVRVRSVEIGLRSRPLAGTSAQISVYRTEVFDDIFSVSPAGTTGIFFQNIGRTRRQGFEANVRSKLSSMFEATVSYAFTRATFEEEVMLNTPRLTSDCTSFACNERVLKGNEFPLVPRHRARAGLEARPFSWLIASVSGSYVGTQRLRGDEENVAPLLPSYFSLEGGLKGTWGRLSGSLSVVNLLGARYSTFGTYATNAKAPGDPVERFLTPGRPFQLFVGLSYGL